MKIKYSKRETKNMGNYESSTVEISIEDVVDSHIETKEECFLRLRKFVHEKLSNEFNKEPKDLPLNNVDIENVKNKVTSLINTDENNRKIIKLILAVYNATKLQELNQNQLEEVNKKLDKL